MVSAGKGHIPGRVAEAADLESVPSSNDIYEVVDCEPITPLFWQMKILHQFLKPSKLIVKIVVEQLFLK